MAKAFNDDKSKVEVAEQTIVNTLLASELKIKVYKDTNVTATLGIGVRRQHRVPSGTVAAIPVITGSSGALLGLTTACSIDIKPTGKEISTWIANNSNYTFNGDLTTYVFYTGEDDS